MKEALFVVFAETLTFRKPLNDAGLRRFWLRARARNRFANSDTLLGYRIVGRLAFGYGGCAVVGFLNSVTDRGPFTGGLSIRR